MWLSRQITSLSLYRDNMIYFAGFHEDYLLSFNSQVSMCARAVVWGAGDRPVDKALAVLGVSIPARGRVSK